MSPYLPYKPNHLVDEIVAAADEGCAICHLHVRDPETGKPASDVNLFREISTKVKSRCDVILCYTTGGGLGMAVEERVKPVIELKPEMASFNAGSINFCLLPALEKYKEWHFDWEKPYIEMTEDLVYPNTFKTLREYSEHFGLSGTKPEFEIFDTAMIHNVAYLISKGFVEEPVYLQFVLGILGGMPPTPQNLMFLVESARRSFGDFQFSVCAAGRSQFKMCTQSLLLGGHVRVGLEDNLYLDRGVLAKSSVEQVRKMMRIAGELGFEPAAPDEAREILGLKGSNHVGY
jgi:uncharacterized protein (DUF849 family)